MRSTAVLFRGPDQVIEAYTAMDVPSWSMWAGKDQLLFSYSGKSMQEGTDDLRQALEMLRKGGTTAQLTLKVYDDLQGKIKSNTPFDNSFGFSLFGFDEENPVATARTQGYRNLEDRIDQLQEIILKMNEKEEDQEKPAGVMGYIGTILEHPDMQKMIMGAVSGWVGKFFGNKQPTIAAMAGVNDNQQQADPWASLPADQQQKLQQAMPILMKADPLIGDHLLALAHIAKNEPGKYNMALKFL